MRAPPMILAAVLALAGCGGGGGSGLGHRATPTPTPSPREGEAAQGAPSPAPPSLGYPVLATKNTTRIAGADPVADAAGVARAVFPDAAPRAVALVDSRDWRAGIAAAELAGPPLRAPVLLARGASLPAVTRAALRALRPTGTHRVGGAQVLRVGTGAAAAGYKTADVSGAGAPALAAAIDRVQLRAAGKPSPTVVVASADHPEYAMPAAAWAAKAGAPVLWTAKDRVPRATVAAIRRHGRPLIFVLGPAAAVSGAVVAKLRTLGPVTRIARRDPVSSAIAFARAPAGWNVRDPGHGLVFASVRRPLDAAAAAPLSAAGSYGPLLLLSDRTALPAAVRSYLLDIEPGYDTDPVRGVYNHGWLIGDQSAIAAAAQGRIDTLLEIQPVQTNGD